jgi:hypothetical protein
MNKEIELNKKFVSLVTSKWKMKVYMLSKLPLAFVAGLSVERFDRIGATVSVPFRFINKNPFGSIYFAPLSMAAELSSGLLALEAVKSADRPVSMLVLQMNAEYYKKAKTRIFFSCNDRQQLHTSVQKAVETSQGQTFESIIEGVDLQGDLVARFRVTWTFKSK